MRFISTLVNEHNVYSPGSGLFTAPVGGICTFHSTLCTDEDKAIWVEIYASGHNTVGKFTVGDARWNNCASGSTTVRLQAGCHVYLDRVKRIWYLSPMRAAKVQASLRIRAVSPEPPLLAHTSSESRGTFKQKARSLAPLNGWTCAVKICHDGMLEDTNSLDGAHLHVTYITSAPSLKSFFYMNTFSGHLISL